MRHWPLCTDRWHDRSCLLERALQLACTRTFRGDTLLPCIPTLGSFPPTTHLLHQRGCQKGGGRSAPSPNVVSSSPLWLKVSMYGCGGGLGGKKWTAIKSFCPFYVRAPSVSIGCVRRGHAQGVCRLGPFASCLGRLPCREEGNQAHHSLHDAQSCSVVGATGILKTKKRKGRSKQKAAFTKLSFLARFVLFGY